MSKYRKKPVIIEAFKWTGDVEQKEDPIWIVEAIKEKKVWFGLDEKNNTVKMFIDTLEGIMIANQGDYIIKGVRGEIYPCKPEIFKETYEKIVIPMG